MSNRISVAFALNIYLICYFLQKGIWVLRSLLSEGRYFRGRGWLLPGFANIRYFPGLAEQFLNFGARWPPTLRWGGGANLAVLSLLLFRTTRLLNLSWVIVERSHVYKFQAAEKYLSPAEPWLHMLGPPLEVWRSWYYTVGSCNPFILSSMSLKWVRDHIINQYNSF